MQPFDIQNLEALVGARKAQLIASKCKTLTELYAAVSDESRWLGKGTIRKLASAAYLAHARSREALTEQPLCDTADKAASILREEFVGKTVETFGVLSLNSRRRVIGFDMLSTGTLDTLLFHPRELFRAAIQRRASAVVIAHNHPSGDSTPSEADLAVTRKVAQAGKLIGIECLDHIIVGQPGEHSRGHSSLRELGYLTV